MKRLIILAHPSSHGFARKMAIAYLEASTAAQHEVRFLDLYQLPQNFLTFEHIKERVLTTSEKETQATIAWADELSFFFPLWWGYMPAILKNFFDVHFTKGFAYVYEHSRPRGLLTGKTAKLLVTSDGPKIFQYLLFFPLKILTSVMIFKFCGVRVTKFKFYDRMLKKDSAWRDAELKNIEKNF